MSDVGDGQTSRDLGGVVGALFDAQSYRNALYLLLSFPLGLAYFVGLTVGLALGVGLAVILIGIPILFAVLLTVRTLAGVERVLANVLLGTEISQPASLSGGDLRSLAEQLVRSRATWMAGAFLLLKLWIGVAGFVLVVTGGALAGAFVTAPLHYSREAIQFGPWVVDTLLEAVLVVPLGVVLAIVTVNLVNALADAIGIVATSLLDAGDEFEAVAAPGPE